MNEVLTFPYEALGESIIVRLIQRETESVSAGGVIVPMSVSESDNPPTLGEIIAVGPDIDLGVEAGDAVVLSGFGGVQFDHDKKKYRIIRKVDILAKRVH